MMYSTAQMVVLSVTPYPAPYEISVLCVLYFVLSVFKAKNVIYDKLCHKDVYLIRSFHLLKFYNFPLLIQDLFVRRFIMKRKKCIFSSF